MRDTLAHFRTIAVSLCLLLLHGVAPAQDYMEDLRGEGNPLTASPREKDGDIYFRFNTSDESIKLGIFKIRGRKRAFEKVLGTMAFDRKQPSCDTALARILRLIANGEKVAPADYSPCSATLPTTARFTDFGWGAYVKGKPTDGASTIFSGGALNMGTRLSGYLMYRRTRIESDRMKYSFMVVPSIAWQANAFDLANRSAAGVYQFSDTSLSALDLGLSFVFRRFIGKATTGAGKPTEVFFGLSVTQAQPTTYDDLDKVTLSQTTSRTDTINGAPVVTTTEVKGKTAFALGPVKRLDETRIRLNVAILPDLLNRRIAFNLYPSLNIREGQDARLDMGFSINLLGTDDKLLSIGGATFEFGDLTNIAESDKSFLSRSFRFGLNAGLNIEGLFAKK